MILVCRVTRLGKKNSRNKLGSFLFESNLCLLILIQMTRCNWNVKVVELPPRQCTLQHCHKHGAHFVFPSQLDKDENYSKLEKEMGKMGIQRWQHLWLSFFFFCCFWGVFLYYIFVYIYIFKSHHFSHIRKCFTVHISCACRPSLSNISMYVVRMNKQTNKK